MIKHYLIVSYRNLLRQKTYALINIIGLAIGLVCSFLIFLHVFTELSYDDHFANADNIYRIAVKASMSDNSFDAAVTGGPLGNIIYGELPEVIKYTRLREGRMTLIGNNDKSFYEENILYADSTFFDVFSFKIIAGDRKEMLKHPYSIVLSESAARKFFGDGDPIGSYLNWNNEKNYLVTGIVEDIEKKTHLNFDILVSFSTLYQSNRMRNFIESLYAYSTLNCIQVSPSVNRIDLENKIDEIVQKHMGEGLESYGGTYDVYLQPITSIYLHSNILHELRTNSDIVFVYVFTTIAILILIIACINFINLSTARSIRRSREVGLRKVFGANQLALYKQFLIETEIQVFLSAIIAFFLFDLSLPKFNQLTGNQFETWSLVTFSNMGFVLGLIVMVGFVAGSYPALLMSRFRPIKVLKGVFRTGGNKALPRNIMVEAQFIISLFLVSATILIYKQLSFIHDKDLGINHKDIMVVSFRNTQMAQNYKSFKAELSGLPGVEDVTGSSSYLGNFQLRRGFYPEGGTIDNMMLMVNIQTDNNYLEMIEANFVSGRNFHSNSQVDSNCIIINKAYLKELGWKNPLGKKIFIPNNGNDDYALKIIGVVDDFNFASLHELVQPLIIMNDANAIRYVSIKLGQSNQNETFKQIAGVWNSNFPEYPFEYFIQEEKYREMYTSEVSMGELFLYFTLFGILIAAMGLYALSSFFAEQRTREIGIRKVLGSSVNQILFLLSKEISKLILIALVISIPFSWFGMSRWLQNFEYQTPISWWIYAISSLVLILVTGFTAYYNALKAAKSNPINAINYE